MESTSTKTLLRSIGFPDESGDVEPIEPVESKELYDLARRNKIGSLYIQALDDAGEISELTEEFENRKGFKQSQVEGLQRAVDKMPDAAEVALVKSGYDVWVDSKDVDFLVFEPSLEDFERHFRQEGYEFRGRSPSSFDVRDEETGLQLDVQDSFTLQSVRYLDAESVRPRISEREIHGVDVPAVSLPDDLAIVVIHSVTEQLFLLKEFYAAAVILQQFDEEDLQTFFQVVDANENGAACSAFFTLVREIAASVFDEEIPYVDRILEHYPPYQHELAALRKSGYETPHRYTGRTGIYTVATKLHSSDFRRDVASQIPRMLHPATAYHIGSQLVLRRQREHYVHDTSDMG